jgi:hypothetical protein
MSIHEDFIAKLQLIAAIQITIEGIRETLVSDDAKILVVIANLPPPDGGQ